MGERLNEFEREVAGEPLKVELATQVRVNGRWVDNDKYKADPEYYNKLPFTEEYIKECGLDPEIIHPDMLPESLKK